MLSPEAILEFKGLYLKEYGISLTDNQAIEYGNRLIGLVKAVYGNELPAPKDIDNEANKDNN